MTLFRIYLVLTAILIVSYTAATAANHGLNLLPVFFGDMAQMSWPGQFNADFFSFLMLGELWLAYSHQAAGPTARPD